MITSVRIHRNLQPKRQPAFIIRSGGDLRPNRWWKEYRCPLCGFWTIELPRLWHKRYCCNRCHGALNVYFGGLWWQKSGIDQPDDNYAELPEEDGVIETEKYIQLPLF